MKTKDKKPKRKSWFNHKKSDTYKRKTSGYTKHYMSDNSRNTVGFTNEQDSFEPDIMDLVGETVFNYMTCDQEIEACRTYLERTYGTDFTFNKYKAKDNFTSDNVTIYFSCDKIENDLVKVKAFACNVDSQVSFADSYFFLRLWEQYTELANRLAQAVWRECKVQCNYTPDRVIKQRLVQKYKGESFGNILKNKVCRLKAFVLVSPEHLRHLTLHEKEEQRAYDIEKLEQVLRKLGICAELKIAYMDDRFVYDNPNNFTDAEIVNGSSKCYTIVYEPDDAV